MIATFLGWLESLFGWLLAASWQASVLAALVLLLQWALRGKLNPRWHHALWLLVVVRLILPILPESTLSLFQFAPSPPPAIAQTVTEPIFVPPPELAPSIHYVPVPSARYPFSAFTALALIWLVSAWGLLILTWQINRRFIRHVTASPRITDPHLLKLAETAQKELGIRRSLRIIESAQVQSPAIMGLFRPTLILPECVRAKFSDEELRFIFLHEFAHLKRGDLILQWVIALLQILHWFNPVLWYAFRRMRIDREPATDALVLSHTGEAQKESYGQVLVKLLEHYHTRHALPTLVGILEDKDQFKRRFSLIARFTRGAYGWSLLGVLAIGMLAVLCLTKRGSSGSETIKPIGSAIGHVIDEQDHPIIGAKIETICYIGDTTFFGPQPITFTDAGGNFSLEPEKGYEAVGVRVSAPGFARKIFHLSYNGADNRLVMGRGVTVTGSLTKDGKPLANIQVGIAQTNLFSATFLEEIIATTNQEGRFAFRDVAPHDVFEVHAKRDSLGMLGVTGEIRVETGDPDSVISVGNLTVLPGVAVSGKIELSDGKAPVMPSDSPVQLHVYRHHGINGSDGAFDYQYINLGRDVKFTFLARTGETLTLSAWIPGYHIPTTDETEIVHVTQDLKPIRIVYQPDPPPNASGNAATQSTPTSNSDAGTNPQLLDTVRKGDASSAQKLIDAGADPKATDKNGRTLLFDAGSPEVAKLLITYGVDPNARDSSGSTALSSLCLNGGKKAADTVRILLQHGADPNARNGELKMTPIMGVRDGNLVDVLMQYGADIKAVDSEGNNALFWSTWQDVSTFEALLRHGFPFDPKTDGPTILVHGTWNHNLPLVAWLLAHGVDPNSPGVWVHNHGQPDMMMLPICATAISGQPEAAKLLLEHGAKGEEATVLALQNHYSNIVKILWEHGVRNISELCYAISQDAPLGDLEKILQNGAPVDSSQDAIITPLGEAAEMDNLPAVQLLVQHGADANKGGNPVAEHSEYRDTPLVLAAERGQDEIVAFLLQHGAQANPNAVSGAANAGIPNSFYVGKNHLPSKEHYERVIQMLIDAGASKDITPEWSGRILAQAMSPCWGDPDPLVLQKLLAAGLSPEVPMPYLKERGEKPNSIIGYYRAYYQKNKDTPGYDNRAVAIKPLLDMLAAADKGPGTNPTYTGAPANNLPMVQTAQKGDATTIADTGASSSPATISRQIIDAVKKDDAAALVKLVDGVNVGKILDGDEPLLFMTHNHEIAKILLEHGADPNARWGDNGDVPLFRAQDAAMVDLLIAHGADPKLKSNNGNDALDYVGWQDPSVFDALRRGGVPFDVRTNGPDKLQNASSHGNIPLMTKLLALGVDPNKPGAWFRDGPKVELMSSLNAAVNSGSASAVAFLLDHGAKTEDGKAKTMVIAVESHPDIAKLLWSRGNRDVSPLLYAISQGASVQEIAELLDQGNPADPPQDDELTPLGYVARKGNLDAVKLLVARGADVDKGGIQTAKYSDAPVALAAFSGQDEVVGYLLAHGAKPDPAALYEAAHNSTPYPNERTREHFEKTARLLLDAGALENATPEEQGYIVYGPIWTRPRTSQHDRVKMILDAGGNPNAPMPFTAENGEKPNTVIGYYRDYCGQHKEDPAFGTGWEKIKPLLDMLEAADKPSHADSPTNPPDATAARFQNVAVSGKLQLVHPKEIDLVKSVGYLQNVDGGSIEFYFQSDGSFAVPNVKPGVYNRRVHFVPTAPGADAVDMTPEPLTIDGSAARMTTNLSLDVRIATPPKGSIQIGLKVLEISDDVYLANKSKINAAVEKADIGFFNNLEGASLLSMPSVSTQPGAKATIDIVRVFPYPTEFEAGKIVPHAKVTSQGGGTTYMTLIVPTTPCQFTTKDLGVSAEITPTINAANSPDPGKIVLNGKFSVTDFDGFTKSNVVGPPGMPSFTTRESLFLEALDNKQEKGIWIPGEHVAEQGNSVQSPGGIKAAASTPLVKKRFLLFVSANLTK